MISGERILSIFRTKGGGDESIRIANELPEAQRTILRQLSGQDDKPLIAGFRSEDTWFVITLTQLVVSSKGSLQRVDLSDIVSLKHPGSGADLADGKFLDGRFELTLRDGSVFEIQSDPGKPYIGLVNVFMYLAKMNKQKPTVRQG